MTTSTKNSTQPIVPPANAMNAQGEVKEVSTPQDPPAPITSTSTADAPFSNSGGPYVGYFVGGTIALAAIVGAALYGARMHQKVQSLKNENRKLRAKNDNLESQAKFQPASTVVPLSKPLRETLGGTESTDKSPRLDDMALSLQEIKVQLASISEHLTVEKETTIERLLAGMANGLKLSTPIATSHQFLDLVDRLCSRWLTYPILNERLAGVLHHYQERAKTCRMRVAPLHQTKTTYTPEEIGGEIVALLSPPERTSTFIDQDWNWLSADWREYLYRLGHELDSLLEEGVLTDGEKVTAEEDLSLLFEALDITPIIANPGSRVDYDLHEVIARVRASSVAPNSIMRTKRRGYSSASKVVKKAEVIVGVD